MSAKGVLEYFKSSCLNGIVIGLMPTPVLSAKKVAKDFKITLIQQYRKGLKPRLLLSHKIKEDGGTMCCGSEPRQVYVVPITF